MFTTDDRLLMDCIRSSSSKVGADVTLAQPRPAHSLPLCPPSIAVCPSPANPPAVSQSDGLLVDDGVPPNSRL